jgi:primosomal protein N' (replication factor Y)
VKTSVDRFGIFAIADATTFELTYKIPDSLQNIAIGALCVVPIQKRFSVGVFLSECLQPDFKCREIVQVVPWTFPLATPSLNLAHWIASYYLVGRGRAFRLLAPSFIWNPKVIERREKRFQKNFAKTAEGTISAKESLSAKIRGEVNTAEQPPAVLREEQQKSLDIILKSEEKTVLLHGVTGSGKTEVYLEAARQTIASGKKVLVLVPEISLTPQMTSRFRGAFGEKLSVIHSMLTSVEYEREWFRVHLGFADIVLGVRSAVFAPLRDIGLIIVDEEHDSSYKCDEMPCYNARDVAVKRASLENSRCVLGSATPSLESYTNVQQKRYALATLDNKHSGFISLVEVFDAKNWLEFSSLNKRAIQKISRSSLVKFENNVIIPPIVERIRENRNAGEQSMVILNRRGYANYAMCTSCGNALQCPRCSVSTTLHAKCATERCHYCDFEVATRTACPSCGCDTLVAMGAGTQNLEQELAANVPGLRVARLDRDMLTSNTRLSEILRGFRDGEFDCLVGTQLLSKGHDFPRVTLIAIIHVEDGLFLPDFRATERTFQLLTQAAGRSGRGAKPGRVVVQSLIHKHPVIDLALSGNVSEFLEREIQIRRMAWHPPITRQILIEVNSPKADDAMAKGQIVRETLVAHWKTHGFSPDEVRLIGPHPATLEKLRNIYRVQLAITATRKHHPAKLIPECLLFNAALSRSLRFDVDPQSFL